MNSLTNGTSRRSRRRLDSLHGVVLRQFVPPDASLAEQDVLAQTDAVEHALRSLGCTTTLVECGLDLSLLRQSLEAAPPDFVFNLVESLGGSDRLAPVSAAFLESLGTPATGSSFAAWSASNDKLRAKAILREAGLATPDWWTADEFHGEAPEGTVGIAKSIAEHASLDLDDSSVVVAARSSAARSRRGASPRHRFIERFVDGREFNLSLLARDDGSGAEVLPPAEIVFEGFPPEKPRIVGWAAKWDASSFEYAATPRRFDFPASDASLLRELESLALACWDVFGLAGYARVDFRVDADGRPWILEANANPCLAPDAGFAAALAQAEIAYEEAVRRIVGEALRRPAVAPPSPIASAAV